MQTAAHVKLDVTGTVINKNVYYVKCFLYYDDVTNTYIYCLAYNLL